MAATNQQDNPSDKTTLDTVDLSQEKCPDCGWGLTVQRDNQGNAMFICCVRYMDKLCDYSRIMPEAQRLRDMGAQELPGFEEGA